MSHNNSPMRSATKPTSSAGRVIPLRICTDPPAAPPPVVDDPQAQMYVCVEVKYDVEAVAQVIAPILDYDPSLLARALQAGPVLDGPHLQADAVSLASALSHFGVSCAFEPFQSLGQMPTVAATNGENPAGRYVYGSTQGVAKGAPPHGKTGIGR